MAVIAMNEVLDEGIELHPLEIQRQSARELRQIGVGIMGLADMLIKLGIRYGSEESLLLSDEIGYVLSDTSLNQSALLAKDHGAFPRMILEKVLQSPYIKENATKETYELIKQYGLRNSQLLTIAPTGSISTMFGVSGGVEPMFMLSYTRKTETLNDGRETYYKVHTPIVFKYMQENNIKDEKDLPDYFVTAMDLNYEDRIKMQAVWQKHIDAAISSTVNLPESATVEEVKDLYVKAWENGLKGITIYRDNCERTGILTSDVKVNKDYKDMSIEELQDLIFEKATKAIEQNPNQCPMCGGGMFNSGGCSECYDCGYSPCSL